MTTPPDMPRADRDRLRAEEEAADWLLVLAEAPGDDALARRFEAWHRTSALNAEVWARTRRAYDLAGRGAAHPSPHGRRPAPAMRRRRRVLAGAAGLALAACLALAVVPDALLRLEADAVTAAAERRDLTLADGSRVRLAPESAVEIDYSDGLRQVRLLKGQAFFQVVPDAARPFRVAAGATTATVLGTAFDVARGDGGARIAVREGCVRVEDAGTRPPTRAELAPGDWIDVTWQGAAYQGNTPAAEVAAWLGGEVVARDRPAGEVVAALRPYYKGAILVQSRRFADRRVSGIYGLHDPAATLADLAASHGAVMRRVSPWLLVVTDW